VRFDYEAENKVLRKQIKVLEMEREILKKADGLLREGSVDHRLSELAVADQMDLCSKPTHGASSELSGML